MRVKMNDYERRWNNETRKWVYTHRKMMESHLGRMLSPREHVHHRNGNCQDNRIENLELVSVASHMSKHSPVYQRIFRPVTK